MAQPKVTVNGREYQIPESFDLGEMCDAEELFGVDFNNVEKSSIRNLAATLYIAIKRVDPSVTVEDIRALPPETFESLTGGDASPPEIESSESSEKSSETSIDASDVSETNQNHSGDPGSVTVVDSALTI